MKNKKKRVNEKAQGRGIEIFVIGVVVLAVVIILITRMGYFNPGKLLDNLIPDFLRSNSTEVRPPCPPSSLDFAYIGNDKYIYFDNQKSKIYLKGDQLLVNVGNWISADPYLGNVMSDNHVFIPVLNNLDEANKKIAQPQYNGNLYGKENLLTLSKSFFYGNAICVPESFKIQQDKQKECVVTCALVDGVCSSAEIPGKISDNQLNCKNGESCYVDPTDEKLKSDHYELSGKSFMNSNTPAVNIADNVPKLENVLGSSSLSIVPGDKIQFRIFVNYDTPFCYIYENDIKYYMKQSEYQSNIAANTYEESPRISYSCEKFVHFIVWNPETNEKVIKRWKIESRPVSEDEPGEQMCDTTHFLRDMKKADVGSVYYVYGLDKDFGPVIALDYKIKKISSSRVSIYAFEESTNTWHELKCASLLYSSIAITDIYSDLWGTLDKSCKW